MKWKQEFCTGLDELDVQHRYFLSLISAMDDDSLAGWSRDRLRLLLREVQRFAHCHFRSEERLMDAYDFAGGENHRSEHDAIESQIESFIDQALLGGLDPFELRTFLYDWFVRHTTVLDRPLANHVLRSITPVGSAGA